jgi:hypothetical protein
MSVCQKRRLDAGGAVGQAAHDKLFGHPLSLEFLRYCYLFEVVSIRLVSKSARLQYEQFFTKLDRFDFANEQWKRHLGSEPAELVGVIAPVLWWSRNLSHFSGLPLEASFWQRFLGHFAAGESKSLSAEDPDAYLISRNLHSLRSLHLCAGQSAAAAFTLAAQCSKLDTLRLEGPDFGPGVDVAELVCGEIRSVLDLGPSLNSTCWLQRGRAKRFACARSTTELLLAWLPLRRARTLSRS